MFLSLKIREFEVFILGLHDVIKGFRESGESAVQGTSRNQF